jgi:pimeloyl-ACP methyl ester carboxylesterase
VKVGRRYVEVDGLEVHVREAGTGRPVLLIHECPRSSLGVLPLLEALARHGFRAYAPDLPGFGHSERLRVEEATIGDLADHVAGTLEALGVVRCAVYGMHTGAKVALELAHRRPDLVAGLVLDGLSANPPNPALVPGQGYLAGFVPRQDGAHLAELWTRERDQYRFYPWHEQTLRTRLLWPGPEADVVQAHLLDLLLAGPEFGRTYVAPYRYSGAESIARAGVPAEIVCREDDLLFPHLDRLPPLPAHCNVRKLPADADAWGQAVLGALQRFSTEARKRATADAPPTPGVRGVPGVRGCSEPGHGGGPTKAAARQERRGFVSTSTGLQSFRQYGADEAPVLLALPPFPGAAASDRRLHLAASLHARVIAPDLPGCGDAEPLPAGVDTHEGTADRIAAVLASAAAREVVVYAPELTHSLALAFARRHRGGIARIVLEGGDLHDDQREAAARALPDLRPAASGEHLHRAWHLLRDRSLAWPWFSREAAGVRRVEPLLDAEQLQAAFVELMKAPDTTLALWRELWSAAGGVAWGGRGSDRVEARTLDRPGVPITLVGVAGDPAFAAIPHDPQVHRIERGPSEEDRYAAVAALLRVGR